MSESPKWQWDVYYKVVPSTPKATLLVALKLFEDENYSNVEKDAIDVGCGHGPDTIELLKRGWNVLAIDREETGLEIIRNSINPEWTKSLELQKSSFEDMKLKSVNLINASLSLPFCRPEHFKKLWNEIDTSIITGGRFAGHFFGMRDSWAEYENMIFHDQSDIEGLFQHYKIEHFVEKEYDGFQAGGVPKHWHIYEVVAKKRL